MTLVILYLGFNPLLKL